MDAIVVQKLGVKQVWHCGSKIGVGVKKEEGQVLELVSSHVAWHHKTLTVVQSRHPFGIPCMLEWRGKSINDAGVLRLL